MTKPTRERVYDIASLIANGYVSSAADAIMALYEDKPCPEATHPQTPCPACGKVGYWTAHYHEGGELLCDCQKPPKWEEEYNRMDKDIGKIRDFIQKDVKAAYKRGVADERKRITDFIKGTGFDEEDIAYLIQSIERDEKEGGIDESSMVQRRGE